LNCWGLHPYYPFSFHFLAIWPTSILAGHSSQGQTAPSVTFVQFAIEV
jgi:hypothetical protein